MRTWLVARVFAEVRQSKTIVLGLGFSARVIHAVVFFEGFLREPVKGERRYGTFEVRSCYTPGAAWTAPACEFVIFEPNHAS